MLDAVPDAFAECVKEPAFNIGDTTFCLWRGDGDAAWSVGPVEFPDEDDPDGSEHLLAALDGRPETYRDFAAEYYEKELELDAIGRVYAHEPLTTELVMKLNPNVKLKQLKDDMAEIGYGV